MSELTDMQAAVSRAIEILHESINEYIPEGEISATGIGIELYLVGMMMKQQYWPAATKITGHYCSLIGVDEAECHDMAIQLVRQAQEEMAEKN